MSTDTELNQKATNRLRKEERVRAAKDRQGREHDCDSSGCTKAPNGANKTDSNKATRKPLAADILQDIADLASE